MTTREAIAPVARGVQTTARSLRTAPFLSPINQPNAARKSYALGDTS
jgi:hypothetical protein